MPMMKDGTTVPRRDINYPSLPHPTTPLMAQPVYDDYSSQQQQQHQYVAPHQQTYVRQMPPPVTDVDEPLPYRGNARKEGCYGMMLKLFVFHLLNAILGIVAFIVMICGVSLSLGLLPLCCFGIVVFRLVLYIVRVCAKLDVKLCNFVSPPEGHVYVSIPERAAFYGLEGERLAPNVTNVSSRSFGVVLYYLTIKPLVSLLSLIVFVAAAALSFLVSYPLMVITARLSRSLTVCFCCERFSTRANGSGGVQLEFGHPKRTSHPSVC